MKLILIMCLMACGIVCWAKDCGGSLIGGGGDYGKSQVAKQPLAEEEIKRQLRVAPTGEDVWSDEELAETPCFEIKLRVGDEIDSEALRVSCTSTNEMHDHGGAHTRNCYDEIAGILWLCDKNEKVVAGAVYYHTEHGSIGIKMGTYEETIILRSTEMELTPLTLSWDGEVLSCQSTVALGDRAFHHNIFGGICYEPAYRFYQAYRLLPNGVWACEPLPTSWLKKTDTPDLSALLPTSIYGELRDIKMRLSPLTHIEYLPTHYWVYECTYREEPIYLIVFENTSWKILSRERDAFDPMRRHLSRTAWLRYYGVVELTFPDTLRVLKPEHLQSYNRIDAIRLPKGVKRIEKGAFDGLCISTITFPDGMNFEYEGVWCDGLRFIRFEGAPPINGHEGLLGQELCVEYLTAHKDAFPKNVHIKQHWGNNEMKEVDALTPIGKLMDAMWSIKKYEHDPDDGICDAVWWGSVSTGDCWERTVLPGETISTVALRTKCTNITHSHERFNREYLGEIVFVDKDGRALPSIQSFRTIRNNGEIKLLGEDKRGLRFSRSCSDFTPVHIHWDGERLESVAVFTYWTGNGIAGAITRQCFQWKNNAWHELPSEHPIETFLDMETWRYENWDDPSLELLPGDRLPVVAYLLPDAIIKRVIIRSLELSFIEFYREYWKYHITFDGQDAYLFIFPNKLWYIFSKDYQLLYKSEPIL